MHICASAKFQLIGPQHADPSEIAFRCLNDRSTSITGVADRPFPVGRPSAHMDA